MVVPHGGLQVAVAVAEVADHALAALERRHEHSSAAIAREQECAATDAALAQARLENQRLRATIEALEALQIRGEADEGAGDGFDTKQVSYGCMSPDSSQTSSHVPATRAELLYESLKRKVESASFLEKLGGPHTDLADEAGSLSHKVEGKSEEETGSWFMITEHDFTKLELKEERDGLGSDGYIIVSQEDIVDGIACFMAKYISTIPQAKKMSPKELQQAISKAFGELEGKGKLRKLWDCGKYMYTAASWGATAVGIYRNPLIVRAALMAVWTSCCIILQLIT